MICCLLAWQPALAGPQTSLYRSNLAETDMGGARLSGKEVGFVLEWPLEGAGPRPAGWGLEYAYTRYEYDNLPTRNRDLHRVEAPVAWVVPGQATQHLEFRPVIATSSNVMKDLFKRGTSDDLMLQGRWALESAPSFAAPGWRAGVAYDDAFGGQQLYPELAALWRGPGYDFGLGWPRSWASYQVSNAWRLGTELAPAGARWHVVSDERGGASFDYEIEAWRAIASARWQAGAGFLLSAQAGLEFNRRHRFEDDEGARVNREADDALYLELRIGYRW